MRSAVVVVVVAVAAFAGNAPLRVVPDVDFARYAGVWYEIARLPAWFENSCVSDVTAEYAPRPDGRIDVINRCRKADGTMKQATGIARRVDGSPPSVLKVRFAPALLTWLPQVWGDYQIMSLAPDYSYALIGTPDRKYLWILARTPAVDHGVLQQLLDQARAEGFDVSNILMPPHRALTSDLCPLPRVSPSAARSCTSVPKD
jgi:apolipoprotein D and lipocalin family protein